MSLPKAKYRAGSFHTVNLYLQLYSKYLCIVASFVRSKDCFIRSIKEVTKNHKYQ